MKINILYEDINILAIDKPSGISVHGDGKTKGKTIVDWILKNYPKIENVGEPSLYEDKVIKRPGIVHRLDKDTSGVLLLAKNQRTYEFLKAQFSASAIQMAGGEISEGQNKIKKTYVAIVSGWVREDRGVINKPIGRSPNDFRKRLAGRGARGEMREAITEYKVIKRFEAPVYEVPPEVLKNSSRFTRQNPTGSDTDKNFLKLPAAKFTYLEVKPKTGRTHQIRVHMKFLNHPVVCDSLYNPGKPTPLGIDRLALHAKSIEFKDLKGKTIKVESSLPKEFVKIIK